MKKSLFVFLLLVTSISLCCKQSIKSAKASIGRPISIFFDPSLSPLINNFPFKVSLNGLKIVDTLIANTHINSSLLIHCTSIDTNVKNVLVLSVLNKSDTINLNQYHVRCIEIFSRYDDQIIIGEKFDKYQLKSIQTTGTTPDYKHYFDSLKATNYKGRYDSLLVQIQTNRCLCSDTVTYLKHPKP